jgi:hypothetical protein
MLCLRINQPLQISTESFFKEYEHKNDGQGHKEMKQLLNQPEK